MSSAATRTGTSPADRAAWFTSATTNEHRQPDPRRWTTVSTEPTAQHELPGWLSRGQRWAVGIAVGLGLVLAGYGLAGSYVTVSALAVRRGVPLPGLVPAGIDGGLVAVVVLDLVLAWIGAPVGWLRQLVRVLSVGTIAANAVAGWPDPVAVGLHAAAPVMLLAMVEAGRTVLLRRMGQARGTLREAVPLSRWMLAPWRTWLLWRRMVLWGVTSYRVAVEVELELRRAVSVLRMHYGRGWRRRAPTDLVWMLRTGNAVEQACARVQVLVSGDGATAAAHGDCVITKRTLGWTALCSVSVAAWVPGLRQRCPHYNGMVPTGTGPVGAGAAPQSSTLGSDGSTGFRGDPAQTDEGRGGQVQSTHPSCPHGRSGCDAHPVLRLINVTATTCW